MYRLVEEGAIDPRRYVQIGLRGYWPGDEEFALAGRQGITRDPDARGPTRRDRRGRRDARWTIVGSGPVFISVDIDVLDPAFAPGTGTPEPEA